MHFEDRGQDFLEWDLDADGLVVDCRPFQASAWIGVRVQLDEPDSVKVGSLLMIKAQRESAYRVLRHPVARVVPTPGASHA